MPINFLGWGRRALGPHESVFPIGPGVCCALHGAACSRGKELSREESRRGPPESEPSRDRRRRERAAQEGCREQASRPLWPGATERRGSESPEPIKKPGFAEARRRKHLHRRQQTQKQQPPLSARLRFFQWRDLFPAPNQHEREGRVQSPNFSDCLLLPKRQESPRDRRRRRSRRREEKQQQQQRHRRSSGRARACLDEAAAAAVSSQISPTRHRSFLSSFSLSLSFFLSPSLSVSVRKMSATLPSLLASLAVLLLGRMDRLADACSCSPVHPQQAFCNADVVIRAKAVSEKEVDSGNDIYGNPIKRIQYEIKQIKMFKGPDQDIEFIYTAPSSAVCGVTLDVTGKKEYLIAGKSEGNGNMHITLCDFIIPWDSLSATQKKSLNQRYQMGCECKISRCPSIPCYVSAQDECLWTDWVTEKNINGRQAKHFACIKRSDGSCAWYRGVAPPKKEFLDIEDP